MKFAKSVSKMYNLKKIKKNSKKDLAESSINGILLVLSKKPIGLNKTTLKKIKEISKFFKKSIDLS